MKPEEIESYLRRLRKGAKETLKNKRKPKK
jgi:hypothetical protein